VNTFSFWQRWLLVVGFILILFGVVMALFNGTVVFALFNSQIDPVFWGAAGIPGDAARFQQWIYGVLGATVAGWGVFLAFIAHYPFKAKEKWSRNCVAAGLLLWYVLDTAISLYFGVFFNAIFNAVLLVLGILPLAFTWKHFSQTGLEKATDVHR
jgi:hypothetical protein